MTVLPPSLLAQLVRGLTRPRRIRPVTGAHIDVNGLQWAALVRGGRLYVTSADRPITVGDLASAPEVALEQLPPTQREALRGALEESARACLRRAATVAEA